MHGLLVDSKRTVGLGGEPARDHSERVRQAVRDSLDKAQQLWFDTQGVQQKVGVSSLIDPQPMPDALKSSGEPE